MKKTFSILILASALFFVSCKKEKMDQPANNNPVSKKLVETTVNGPISIAYNADGTVKQITFVRPWTTYVKNFTYAPGKVNYIMTRSNGTTDEVGEYTMVNGKATQFIWTYFETNGTTPIATITENFEYNQKGLMSKWSFNDGYYYTYVYDNNNNVTERFYYNPQNQAIKKWEYSYSSQKELFPWFGYFDSRGTSFVLSPRHNNLLLTDKCTNLLTNTMEYASTFNYQLDKDGYVIKADAHYTAGNFQDYSWTNTFQ